MFLSFLVFLLFLANEKTGGRHASRLSHGWREYHTARCLEVPSALLRVCITHPEQKQWPSAATLAHGQDRELDLPGTVLQNATSADLFTEKKREDERKDTASRDAEMSRAAGARGTTRGVVSQTKRVQMCKWGAKTRRPSEGRHAIAQGRAPAQGRRTANSMPRAGSESPKCKDKGRGERNFSPLLSCASVEHRRAAQMAPTAAASWGWTRPDWLWRLHRCTAAPWRGVFAALSPRLAFFLPANIPDHLVRDAAGEEGRPLETRYRPALASQHEATGRGGGRSGPSFDSPIFPLISSLSE